LKKYTFIEAVKKIKENTRLVLSNVNDPERKLKINAEGWITDGSGDYSYVNLNTEWYIENPPVDFIEAVKAYREGKTIYCTDGFCKYAYEPKKNALEDTSGVGLSADEILNYKWFLKEGE
jgi:hypothetical protein